MSYSWKTWNWEKLREISHMNAFPVRNVILGQCKLFVKVYGIRPIEIYLVSTWDNVFCDYFSLQPLNRKKILFKQLYFLAHTSHTDSLSGTITVFLYFYYERTFLNLSYVYNKTQPSPVYIFYLTKNNDLEERYKDKLMC